MTKGRKSVPKPKGAKLVSLGTSKDRSIEHMEGQELKDYARSIGIMQRDVDGLTEDRLRMNCKFRVAESMED